MLSLLCQSNDQPTFTVIPICCLIVLVPDRNPSPPPGPFIEGSCTNNAGTRGYKVYVPTGYHGQPLPLVVMLHGCTQDPDDFAAGSRMNALAEENSCLVVYPSQPQAANQSRCWNWFNALHQQRDEGEPSLIADITREVIKTYHIDARHVFIAGMSAGGAMAVIMAATYPELYAAVGSHSGMPYRSAKNAYSAMTAMSRGAATIESLGARGIPIIVFQGDDDRRVHASNGDQIIAQWRGSTAEPAPAGSATQESTESNGRAYQRTIHLDAEGNRVAEHWVVNGVGHRWSGGNPRGSHTDSQGPDASREMLRFFLGSLKDPVVDTNGPASRGIFRRYLRALRVVRKRFGRPDGS